MDTGQPGPRILGALGVQDGRGVVRMEDRVAADVEELWSAITDRARLDHWYGEITGDLRLGGEYHARLHASGWEGTGRVEVCELRRRLLLTVRHRDDPDEGVIEVTLRADRDQTVVVWEERGMPVHLLAAYGAGIQVHVEDLVAHIGGQDRCDSNVRWEELFPAYQDLAANVA